MHLVHVDLTIVTPQSIMNQLQPQDWSILVNFEQSLRTQIIQGITRDLSSIRGTTFTCIYDDINDNTLQGVISMIETWIGSAETLVASQNSFYSLAVGVYPEE